MKTCTSAGGMLTYPQTPPYTCCAFVLCPVQGAIHNSFAAACNPPCSCTWQPPVMPHACIVPSRPQGRMLCRGAYRASAAKWFHPESIIAADSETDPNLSKAKQVKLKKASSSTSSNGSYSMKFRVPLQLAPVMLGFRLFIAGAAANTPGQNANGAGQNIKGTGQYVGPAGSRHFTIPVGLQAGHPLPQGALCAHCSMVCSSSLIFAEDAMLGWAALWGPNVPTKPCIGHPAG